MAHARQQIRDAVASALTGLATTGSNVFVSRVYPLESASLPGLTIMTVNDAADIDNTTSSNSNRIVWANLGLLIKAHAQEAANTLDDTLDQIEMEIRQALLADITLGGLVKDLWWISTEITLEGENVKPIGLAEILFNVSYRVAASDPSLLLT